LQHPTMVSRSSAASRPLDACSWSDWICATIFAETSSPENRAWQVLLAASCDVTQVMK